MSDLLGGGQKVIIQMNFFEEAQLGPLKLRNRSIRSAAFEGMCPGHTVSDELIKHHVGMTKGGVALTTVAYASVSKGGLSFPHQLWLREGIIPDLKRLVDAVDKAGAKISIQIGHTGNMANKKVSGAKPIAPTGGINWYGPTFPRSMTKTDIAMVIADFVSATRIAAQAGFDAIEVHAGHGYLISQFLSPFTNRRKDEYGGSFENRSRFLKEVLNAVKSGLPQHMAMLVKMNAWDGFEGGITREEGIETAKIIEACCADAVIVSAGFVSKAPMYIMRGKMPLDIMAHFITEPFKKPFVKYFGKQLIPSFPFTEAYLKEDALRIKQAVDVPVVLVGGMNSGKAIDAAMADGFEFIAMARALIENPNFVNDLNLGHLESSACTTCNYCIAKMYSMAVSCHLHEVEMSKQVKALTERL